MRTKGRALEPLLHASHSGTIQALPVARAASKDRIFYVTHNLLTRTYWPVLSSLRMYVVAYGSSKSKESPYRFGARISFNEQILSRILYIITCHHIIIMTGSKMSVCALLFLLWNNVYVSQCFVVCINWIWCFEDHEMWWELSYFVTGNWAEIWLWM